MTSSDSGVQTSYKRQCMLGCLSRVSSLKQGRPLLVIWIEFDLTGWKFTRTQIEKEYCLSLKQKWCIPQCTTHWSQFRTINLWSSWLGVSWAPEHIISMASVGGVKGGVQSSDSLIFAGHSTTEVEPEMTHIRPAGGATGVCYTFKVSPQTADVQQPSLQSRKKGPSSLEVT